MPAKKKVPLLLPFLIWLFVALLFGELLAKLILMHGQGASAHYSANWEMRSVSEAFHINLWSEPWLNYRPGAEVSHEHEGQTYVATINSLGFRGKVFNSVEDQKVVKIVCIGGSTTVNGPTDGETYPALLEKFINQRSAAKPVKVLNCGIAGMDSGSYGRTLSRLGDNGIVPDLAIEYNGINSICWKLFPYWESKLNGMQKLLLKSNLVRSVFGDLFVPTEAQVIRDLHRFCIEDLERLRVELERNQTKLGVASFCVPDPRLASGKESSYLNHNLRYWWKSNYISYTKLFEIIQLYNKELRETFADSDVFFLPLAESGGFLPEDFFDICHMKPEGVEKKAYLLSRLVQPMLEEEFSESAENI